MDLSKHGISIDVNIVLLFKLLPRQYRRRRESHGSLDWYGASSGDAAEACNPWGERYGPRGETLQLHIGKSSVLHGEQQRQGSILPLTIGRWVLAMFEEHLWDVSCTYLNARCTCQSQRMINWPSREAIIRNPTCQRTHPPCGADVRPR